MTEPEPTPINWDAVARRGYNGMRNHAQSVNRMESMTELPNYDDLTDEQREDFRQFSRAVMFNTAI